MRKHNLPKKPLSLDAAIVRPLAHAELVTGGQLVSSLPVTLCPVFCLTRIKCTLMCP